WVLEERVRREEGYLAALQRLAAAAAERREDAAAARYLRLAIAADPFREDLHRDLMQVLAASGNPAEALLVYRQFRSLLLREMAAEPGEETTALFRRLREETRARAARPIPKPAAAAPASLPASRAEGS